MPIPSADINDDKNWSKGRVRHLIVGHLIHEYKKGNCAKCHQFSSKLEYDPWLGEICPNCMKKSIESREAKNFYAFIYRCEKKEQLVKKVIGVTVPMLSASLTAHVIQTTKDKNAIRWIRDSGYFNGGYYEVNKVGKFYLKEK